MNGFGAGGGMARMCRHACLVQNGSMARTCRHACLVQNGSMQVVHAWDGYKTGTKLAGPVAGQWFCDFWFWAFGFLLMGL